MKVAMFRIIILGLCLSHLGTIHIIKEDGREVGRWEESDGKNETRIIENSLPKSPPKPIDDKAYRDAQMSRPMGDPAPDLIPIIPEGNLEEWKISGKVIDIITLKPLAGVEISLNGSGRTFSAKSFPTGGFSFRVPALKNGNYSFQISPPKGYLTHYYISKSTNYARLPLETRHRMWSSIFFQPLGDDLISGNFYDWSIALLPDHLPKQ